MTDGEHSSDSNGRRKEEREPSSSFRERLVASVFFPTFPDDSSLGNQKEQVNQPVDGRLEGIVAQIDKQIPRDPHALRQTPLFRQALTSLRWQRDNYIVGNEYADWRKRERERLAASSSTWRRRRRQNDDIPVLEGIALQQLIPLCGNFIPTYTVTSTLTPIVAQLPGTVLYQLSRSAVVGIISSQQQNLDSILRNLLLQFLDNPNNRNAIKESTQGLLRTTVARKASSSK